MAKLVAWLDGELNKKTVIALSNTGFTDVMLVEIVENGGLGHWTGVLKAKDINATGTLVVTKVKCTAES